MTSLPAKSDAVGELFVRGSEVNPHDVLMGKGAPICKHGGNRQLRRRVVERSHEYVQATSNTDKHKIAW